MANLISSGFTDFPTTYTGAAGKFLRVSSNISLGTVFSGAELSDLDKVEASGAYTPANGQALIYNSAADRWRPSTLDVYSAGNGVNKSGLTLNVVAGTGGGLESNTNGVFISNIANVAGTYGNATHTPIITVNSKGQITDVTLQESSIQTADVLTTAYVRTISSSTANLTVTGSGTANADVVISLTSTGISPRWYGNIRPNGQIVIPTMSVDSYGRVTEIVEVPISFDGNGNVIPSSNITSYSVFEVEGQGLVVADYPEDTIKFIAGAGLTITTNPNQDSITFSSDTTTLFTNTSISAFSDVGSLAGIQGGQILIWSNVTNKFEYGDTVSASSTIISSDTVPVGASNDSLWFDQVSGRLYILYDDNWVDASPAGGGVNLLAVSTNILPDATSTYSIGNASLQWNELWLADDALHLGNVAVTVTQDGKLAVANANLTSESYVTSATASGNIAYSWGNHANANYLVSSANAITTASAFDLTVDSAVWTFNTTGGLVFPDNTVQFTAYNGTEKFANLSSATGVVSHDCANSRIFYHSGISNNFTANLTNLSVAEGNTISVSLVLAQAGTAYVCNALQIAGSVQSILWQGSASAPTGNANKTDAISFSIMRTGVASYIVLGQLVSFG